MNGELYTLLVTQTLQVTLLVVVVWIVTRLFAKNRPHLAHAMWILVLIKCITPPIWSCPASPFSWLAMPSDTAISKSESVEEHPLAVPRTSMFSNPIVVHVRPMDSKSGDHSNTVITKNSDEPSETPVANLMQPKPNPSPTNWPALAVWVWCVGAALGLFVTAARFAWFLIWLRRSPVISDRQLDLSVQKLARQLGIRRRIRLRVLQKPVGPAVLGLIRPTILLPASIVAGKSAQQLEPLLMHELIHIRRGDLGWAFVQTIAKNLFWFHPLVRLAVAMVTRESERSCDEETVANLECQPATYARGLLEVLEHKHRLRVAPALPGVRPVDITSARLERVMKLGNGIHRRTPVWIWLVMLVCGAIVLPGAALIVAQEGAASTDAASSSELVGQQLPVLVGSENGNRLRVPRTGKNPSPIAKANNGGDANAEKDQWVFKSFDVAEILAKIRAANLKTKTPEQRLILELPCRYPGKDGRSTPLGRDVRFMTEHGEVHLGGQSQTIKVIDDKLYVFDTKPVVSAVTKGLAHLNQHGFAQIVVECRLVSIAREDLSKVGIDWSVGHSAASQLSNPNNNVVVSDQNAAYLDFDQISNNFQNTSEKSRSKVRAASYIEKSSPVMFALVDDDEAKQTIQEIRGFAKSNIRQAPTVTMFSGNTAMVTDGSSRPFVVGLNRVTDEDGNPSDQMQPVIRVVLDGSKVNLKSTANDDESIDLDCIVSFSKVLSVDTAEIPVKSAERNVKIQIPEVATSQIHSSMNIPKGKTLVLGSFRESEKGEKEAFLTMLTCRSIVDIPEFPTVLTTPDKISHAEAARIIGKPESTPSLILVNENGQFEMVKMSTFDAKTGEVSTIYDAE